TQLAEKVGVAYQTIQKFENNTRKPTPEVFVMLARELGTTCEKLVLGENAGR
ncbi:MAG: helix-turn-helix transcriptional regulator, partial [Clostridia bacterium]|nr:helix-turn-helix transcriptional regulator [Clostridia bacterium]